MAGNILTKNEMIIMNVFWEVKNRLRLFNSPAPQS